MKETVTKGFVPLQITALSNGDHAEITCSPPGLIPSFLIESVDPGSWRDRRDDVHLPFLCLDLNVKKVISPTVRFALRSLGIFIPGRVRLVVGVNENIEGLQSIQLYLDEISDGD